MNEWEDNQTLKSEGFTHNKRIIDRHNKRATNSSNTLRLFALMVSGFGLTRFYGEPELMGKSEISIKDDDAWNTLVNVCLTPDQRLTAEQQQNNSRLWLMITV